MTVASNNLTFDAERHEYALNGRKLPSVTQILRATLPGWQAGEFYLQRGRALHHGCRLLDEGRLDWSTVASEIEPRIRAWEKFKKDFPCEIHRIEFQLASVKYGFAGTCDRVIETFSYPHRNRYVVDLKSTIEAPVAVQLGFYSLLLREADEDVNSAVAVELNESGKYGTRWLDKGKLHRAEQTALACLTVYNFQAEHNLLPKKDSNG